MSAIVKRLPVTSIDTPPTPAAPSAWDQLPERKRGVALDRKRLVDEVQARVSPGVSRNAAIDYVLTVLDSPHADAQLRAVAERLSRGGKTPTRATLHRWCADYERGGLAALAPSHKGKVRDDYGWELRALALFHIPSKPTYGAVASQLRREGFESATDSRVRAYLKTMPANLGPNSAKRLGQHYHRLNRGRYVQRDTSVLQVGEVYSMDGHTVDVYLAHPLSGGIWRPELTIVIDIASRYIPGWYVSEAESTHSSMLALSHAMLSHDHVPAWMHVDNGAGFKAKAMSDEALGFYARFTIQPMFSIPGNSKGRGHVERWFRTVRDRHDKLFAGGTWYCGDDMAPEINRRLHDQIRQGKRTLPTLAQYRDSLAAFIHEYNHTPHSGLDGRTPAEVWAGLERVALEVPAQATVRERVMRTVSRATVTLDKRTYTHPDLALYEGKVAVEYSIHDDAHVWVYDDKDRLICMAELVTKADYLPASRLEEQRARRKEGQLKRLQKKLDEVEAQHRVGITHETRLGDIEALVEGQAQPRLEKKAADAATPAAWQQPVPVEIDPYDTDY